MKIKVSKTHQVTFSVSYYEGLEGGMDCGSFGPQKDTLEEAIALLEIANIQEPSRDWLITAEVTTQVSRGATHD